jgi:hypothetical protein
MAGGLFKTNGQASGVLNSKRKMGARVPEIIPFSIIPFQKGKGGYRKRLLQFYFVFPPRLHTHSGKLWGKQMVEFYSEALCETFQCGQSQVTFPARFDGLIVFVRKAVPFREILLSQSALFSKFSESDQNPFACRNSHQRNL